jgi:hypothetical protein
MTHCTKPYRLQGSNIAAIAIVCLAILCPMDTGWAQTDRMLEIARRCEVAVTYVAPARSDSAVKLRNTLTRENTFSLEKQFSDGQLDVTLRFMKYDSHLELSGAAAHTASGDLCATLRVIMPLPGTDEVTWCHDLDSVVVAAKEGSQLGNFVDASTVIPPAGAFNTDVSHNGGYGDKVGQGRMSCYPLAAIATKGGGLAWGVDMGLPLVYRLAFVPGAGMVTEYDLALSHETTRFPDRAQFKGVYFEYDAGWHMRAALEKYYAIQPEYFKKRVPMEGLWLPFAPLYETPHWEDFGFAFHELHMQSRDRGFDPPLSSIEAGKKAGILTFQYTEPWEEEIPISRLDLTYDQVTGGQAIPEQHAEYFRTSAALDKEGKLIARKLETPWFPTGWAVSINANTDPDIKGFNRYDFVRRHEIDPALALNVDGIYFDCVEWHWHYDMNYNRSQFAFADYPLTFSSSLPLPRPVIWSYASNYEFMNRVADEMHRQGKLVMGNTINWIPFAAGILDVFGSELSWYIPDDMKMERFQFLRAIAKQKPVVFLLNEGLDDSAFTRPPYSGYKIYFDRMLFFGFFPSFFSVNATSNIYWADSAKCKQGRPFFRKYIPLIKELSAAGWEPVTFASDSNSRVRVERFGKVHSRDLYFTLYNPTAGTARTVLSIDAGRLGLGNNIRVEEILDGETPEYRCNGKTIEIPLQVRGRTARLVKISNATPQ